MEKAIIISRCSTNETKQDVTRQSFDLDNKYQSRYQIVRNFEYYKSGLSNDEQLSEIINYAKTNGIDHILFTEVSRVARRVIEILLFIQDCTKHKINVVIDNYNMHSLNADKTENTITKTMLQIGAAFSEMELKQTQQRLNSGRSKYIANGGRLGRNMDTKETKDQILEKHKDVVKFLKQGQSIRNIMKLTEKSSATVQKVKQLIAVNL
ncbi:recombinase family protein [Pedobacter sp. MC2016-24]|uniref:recombinase family protein n=1 Tax=Pedobacter sp. MC2016-24 TaxID=2780090 RepID=UPI00187E48ED|nr:recombinase family protein [Pedobacter sp. MC2016-24]MBE9602784.1 recombinase family protein [Pedobacter sp. MC2016-24]